MGESNALGVMKVAYWKRCILEELLSPRRGIREMDKGKEGTKTMKDGIMISHLNSGAQAEF